MPAIRAHIQNRPFRNQITLASDRTLGFREFSRHACRRFTSAWKASRLWPIHQERFGGASRAAAFFACASFTPSWFSGEKLAMRYSGMRN